MTDTSNSNNNALKNRPEDNEALKTLSPEAERALDLAVHGLSSKQRTGLQEALYTEGVTAGWIAKRMMENALAMKPVTYCGIVTGWIPDFTARNKAVEAMHRVRGDIVQAESASAGVAVEISLRERRALQVKIAAKVTAWGRAHAEADQA